MKKTALVCGVTGQDGAYLAHFLLQKGYKVIGTTRNSFSFNINNLKNLDIANDITITSMNPEDFRSVLINVENYNPDEIYFLAGQSSVSLSFDLPTETIKSAVIGTLNLLEVCKMSKKTIKLYHAGSSECFGDLKSARAIESTPFFPKSPYAVAKSSAYWLVNNYRDAYGVFACTGILFNHESPLRPKRFVTKKIISYAKAIAEGKETSLQLGKIDIFRDWGWAPEYVEAMWLILQQDEPDDFIVATGKTHSLEDFVAYVFERFDLDWKKYVTQSEELFRPTDILISQADPSKIQNKLGWSAKTGFHQMIDKMILNQYW